LRLSPCRCWRIWLFACVLTLTSLRAWAEDGPDQAGTLDLEGPWAIQVGDGDWSGVAFDDSSWQQIELPNQWSKLLAESDEVSVFWLRRRLLLGAEWPRQLAPSGLALALGPGYFGSYQAFAGGRLVGRRGGPEAMLPMPRLRAFDIPKDAVSEDGFIVLALRFERVGWVKGRREEPAPFGSMALGDRATLELRTELAATRQDERNWPIRLLWVFSFSLAAFFSFLAWRRRQMKSETFFFAAAQATAGIATWMASNPLEHYDLNQRFVAVALHASVAIQLEFLWLFLSRPIPRPLRFYQALQVGLALLTLLAPFRWLEASYEVRWLLFLPFGLCGAWLIAHEAWQGNVDARPLAIGFGGLALAAAAEIVLNIAHLGSSFPLPAWAFGFFSVSVLVVLVQRAGRVNTELGQIKQALERMVDDRTAELSLANRRLEGEIVERRLAEGAMRMLERAVEQSVDGIAVINLEGQLQFINEAWARLHGYEVFELLGYDISIFHSTEQMQGEIEPLLRRVRERGSFEGEVGHRRRGGAVFRTFATATYLHDTEGEPIGFVFIARDMTERIKADEERQKLLLRVQDAARFESLGALAGGMAHDYNNILTGILGNTSLAIQELPADSPIKTRLFRIEESAERAAKLTDQLLAYAGQDQSVSRHQSLNDLIEESRPYFDRIFADHPKLRLEVHLRKDLPAVKIDPDQIRQAILNLLENAVEALQGEEGTVMLRTSMVQAKKAYFEGAEFGQDLQPGPYVFFEVSDPGSGMEETIRQRMFEPFFSTKESGRGLGLAAVLGIVRAHHGAIKVYSQPGRGATIEVLLPLMPEPTREEDASGGLLAWRAQGKILVVDDESLVRDVAARILQRQGFEVMTAASGEEAVTLYEKFGTAISLVLLDLTMPEMDGEAVYGEIRRLNPKAQILLMSGYSEKSAMQNLGALGIAGFLHKPFRPNELVRKVRAVLAGPTSERPT
jgi:PAS domain S-box-containing protein